MDLPLSERLVFPVKSLIPSVDISKIENFSAFSAVRLAKKSFEGLGFAVYEGADFEDNLCMHFYESGRLFYDEYIKVKLGKSRMTEAKKEYCTELLQVMPEADVRLLLVLCRLCSYTGDPGFPDLILLKNGKWSLAYVLFDQLSLSQKIFLLLSRLVGFDVRIVKLNMQEEDDVLEVEPHDALAAVLDDRRAKNIMNGLEGNINEAHGEEDEIRYLEDEKAKNPLFLFRRWRTQGFASASQLKGAVHFIMTHERNNFETYLEELKNDAGFLSISGRTEDAMRARAEYMQKKFSIGRSRSKLLLNFF